MFFRDCAGHLERHGLLVLNGAVRGHFTRGRKDTPISPGEHHRPLYAPMGRKKEPAFAAASA